MIRWAVSLVLMAGVLAACGGDADTDQVEASVGQCRYLTAADLAHSSNDSTVVDCADPHTAQTFAVGTIAGEYADHDDPDLDAWLYRVCAAEFATWTGADASRAMRSVLTWAWWRPTASQWSDGERDYRCDVISGTDPLTELPKKTRDVLAAQENDRWMICAQGASLDSRAVRVPCTEPHDWRAVTTIKLGEPEESYPGDRRAERLTRQYCSASVSAWLGYPVGYDLGYTWYGRAQWDAGNRRSVCWARTSE